MPKAKSTSIRRDFLGWDKPALSEAAQRLVQRYRHSRSLDLGRVSVVVPGQRAGRRLLELLAFLTADERLLLTPPDVVTEGKLPEKLYTPKLPFASDVVQDLAWAQALRDLPARQRDCVILQPPKSDEGLRWLELGRVMRRLHTEFAADGLDFSAVLTRGPKLANFNEAARWEALAELQRRYLALLDQQLLWDIQTARLKAIEFREITTQSDIVLLGTVDLNNTLRQMLDYVADKVTAYIVAPEQIADRFDRHGCLVAEAWSAVQMPLRDEQLRQVDGPQEQADAVTDWIAELAGQYRKDQVVIGVPDESLVPQLQRQIEQCPEHDLDGKKPPRPLKARWVEGMRIAETAPYRVLEAAVAFAGEHRFEDLAALVRHPDVEDWLRNRGIGLRPCPSTGQERSPVPRAQSLPAQLDRYYNEHLPSKVSAARLPENDKEWPNLPSALRAIEQWLAAAAGTQPLRGWANVFRHLLGVIYGDRELVLDKPCDEALHRTLSKMLTECDRLSEAPEALDSVSVSAADAFRIVMKPLGQEYLPPPADPDALEILGWLELPLDDAPALAVTSFNEGFVPKSTGADAFLPDRLRRELNVLHNERRYARDAYATCVLCHSRPELRVIFARRDTRDEPMQPSRLLFACPDDQLVARAQRFFADAKTPLSPRRLLLGGDGKVRDKSLFKVPEAAPPKDKLARIPVTHFKAYLACPYRYYLRHVCKLEAIDDAARELGGDSFGVILHRVLGVFGRDADGPRASAHERDIYEYLMAQLDGVAQELFGAAQRRPAIRLQLEQARRRLLAFAAHQAELVRIGWRIVYVESEMNGSRDVKTTGGPCAVDFPKKKPLIKLVGRIDRIDYHESSRTFRILDYKTSDQAVTPDRAHRQKGEWIDLQLPLYRHLMPRAELKTPERCAIELAFFNLPKMLEETAVAVAAWNADELADADETACRVIRGILDGQFAMAKQVPKYSEDFAAICMDNVLGAPSVDDGDAGGSE